VLIHQTSLTDLSHFISEQLFDMSEYFRSRVKVLVEKIDAFLVDVLENIVDFASRPDPFVLDCLSLWLKVTLFGTVHPLKFSSKLT